MNTHKASQLEHLELSAVWKAMTVHRRLWQSLHPFA